MSVQQGWGIAFVVAALALAGSIVVQHVAMHVAVEWYPQRSPLADEGPGVVLRGHTVAVPPGGYLAIPWTMGSTQHHIAPDPDWEPDVEVFVLPPGGHQDLLRGASPEGTMALQPAGPPMVVRHTGTSPTLEVVWVVRNLGSCQDDAADGCSREAATAAEGYADPSGREGTARFITFTADGWHSGTTATSLLLPTALVAVVAGLGWTHARLRAPPPAAALPPEWRREVAGTMASMGALALLLFAVVVVLGTYWLTASQAGIAEVLPPGPWSGHPWIALAVLDALVLLALVVHALAWWKRMAAPPISEPRSSGSAASR